MTCACIACWKPNTMGYRSLSMVSLEALLFGSLQLWGTALVVE